MNSLIECIRCALHLSTASEHNKCCLHILLNISALPISCLVSTKNVLLQVGEYLVRTRNVLLQVGECKQSPLKGKVTLRLSSNLPCPQFTVTRTGHDHKPCSKRVRVGRSFVAFYQGIYINAWPTSAFKQGKGRRDA